MNTLNRHDRRRFLKLITTGSASAALLAAVGACSNTPTQPSVWIAGLQSILTMTSAILPQFVSAGLSGANLATAQQIVAEMQQALSTINATSTTVQGQSVLTQIEGYINALAPLLLPFVSLIPGGSYIGLIVAALPAIEAAINFISSLTQQAQQLTPPPLPAAARMRARLGGTQQVAQEYMALLVLEANRRRGHRLHYR